MIIIMITNRFTTTFAVFTTAMDHYVIISIYFCTIHSGIHVISFLLTFYLFFVKIGLHDFLEGSVYSCLQWMILFATDIRH